MHVREAWSTMANMGRLGNSVLANVVWLADSRLASMPNVGRDACSMLANVDGLANSELANPQSWPM